MKIYINNLTKHKIQNKIKYKTTIIKQNKFKLYIVNLKQIIIELIK